MIHFAATCQIIRVLSHATSFWTEVTFLVWIKARPGMYRMKFLIALITCQSNNLDYGCESFTPVIQMGVGGLEIMHTEEKFHLNNQWGNLYQQFVIF